uniref:Uncharacterized protein n=1 Tax=Arundo donax TaxID=35708 RepID=A0A0A9A9C8_ARUDO
MKPTVIHRLHFMRIQMGSQISQSRYNITCSLVFKCEPSAQIIFISFSQQTKLHRHDLYISLVLIPSNQKGLI